MAQTNITKHFYNGSGLSYLGGKMLEYINHAVILTEEKGGKLNLATCEITTSAPVGQWYGITYDDTIKHIREIYGESAILLNIITIGQQDENES